MRVLSLVVQIAALPPSYVGEHFTCCNAIAPQPVGHDHPLHVVRTIQKPAEETHRRAAIAPSLGQDVKHDAVLGDRTPEIVLGTLDPSEEFIHVLCVPQLWPPTADAVGETGRMSKVGA